MNTTTATPTPEALAIAVIFKDFAIDHTPDGWPAVKQMHLSAAAAELERQHAEIEALKAERARSGLAHRMAVQRCVHAAVAEAVAAEREACKSIAIAEQKTMCEIALSHPDGSASRDRLFARARSAESIAQEIEKRSTP